MKSNIGLVLLAVLAAGLAVALLATKQRADERQKSDTATILDFSNQWTEASFKVDDLHQVNLALSNDLATNRTRLADVSNSLTAVSETVTNIRNSLLTAQDQITGQNTRLTDLQTQNQELNDRVRSLGDQAAAFTNKIAELNSKIYDTLQQLADSRTNNAWLEQQLQQLIIAKAALEHKFNTLADVRAQAKKLRDDFYTARRLQWMKEGSDQQGRGAELLIQPRNGAGLPAASRSTNYGLNVELGSDGSARILPPVNAGSTNNAGTNPPAR